MGATLTRIQAAIAEFCRDRGYEPRTVVISAREALPAMIDGARTEPSLDLNPGDFRVLEDRNWAAYWAAALARHKVIIAAGCVSPAGCKRVGKGRAQDLFDELLPDEAEQ